MVMGDAAVTAPKRIDPGQAMRQSAKVILENSARRHGAKAEAIDALLRVIPWESISREDDQRLCAYFCGIKD